MCVGAGCKRGVRWLFEGGVAYPGGGGWAVKVFPWVQAVVDGCPEKSTGLREPDILPFGTQARRLESLPLCRQGGGVPRRPLCHHRTTRLLPAVPAPETYVLQQCSDLQCWCNAQAPVVREVLLDPDRVTGTWAK